MTTPEGPGATGDFRVKIERIDDSAELDMAPAAGFAEIIRAPGVVHIETGDAVDDADVR